MFAAIMPRKGIWRWSGALEVRSFFGICLGVGLGCWVSVFRRWCFGTAEAPVNGISSKWW